MIEVVFDKERLWCYFNDIPCDLCFVHSCIEVVLDKMRLQGIPFPCSQCAKHGLWNPHVKFITYVTIIPFDDFIYSQKLRTRHPKLLAVGNIGNMDCMWILFLKIVADQRKSWFFVLSFSWSAPIKTKPGRWDALCGTHFWTWPC